MSSKFLGVCFIVSFLTYSTGSPESDRIVGGSLANITEFPYQVSLQSYGRHTCGGSIIYYNYVLTAAHCVDGQNKNSLKIRAGSNFTNTGGDLVSVCAVYSHPEYEASSLDYDIAILKLCTNLTFQTTIYPIALPNQNKRFKSNARGIVSGWGAKVEDGPTTKYLRKVLTPLISQRQCASLYKNVNYLVSARMMCAGYLSGGHDACQGDSGGPMRVNGQLAGIVSWGHGCAQPNFPGVYTKVSYFRNWIKSITKI